MGQQPNIQIEYDELPRRRPAPGVARPWRPDRPAELDSPRIPTGGLFGTIGPDSGYALRLVAERDLQTLPGEHHHDLEVAVAAIASARAATLGRAPIADDVTVGMIVLGLDPDTPVEPSILGNRPQWVANVGHDAGKLRGIVADIPIGALRRSPAALRQYVATGWVYRQGSAKS